MTTAVEVYPWVEWGENTGPCAICREPTHYVSWEFVVFVCPGACIDRLWEDYFQACSPRPDTVRPLTSPAADPAPPSESPR